MFRDLLLRVYAKTWAVLLHLQMVGSSLVTRGAFWMAGVRCGARLRCYGPVHVHPARGGWIRIGNGCRFRSSGLSNRIGINRPCALSTLKAGANILVGDGCGFSGTVIAAARQIEIGPRVRCGANTTITDTDWHEEDPRSGGALPVVIEENVWLGLNAIVLKGVRIGRNSVIAAGSVVTRDIPANVVAGGIPARVIRRLSDEVIAQLEAEGGREHA
jgi:acetyltransferase-like isoleucine patch superfamily enzyme